MKTKTHNIILTAAVMVATLTVSVNGQFKTEPGAKPAAAPVAAGGAPAAVSGSAVAPKAVKAGEEITPEQRKVYEEIMASSREETTALRKKMSQFRREMNEATRAEKMDEAAIRAKATEIGKLEGDIAVADAKTYAKLRSQLTQEQVDKIRRTPMFQNRPNASMSRSLSTNAPGPVPAKSVPATPKDK